jgi:hypothetical protein
MSDNRNLGREKIDAFFKGSAGFWTVSVVMAAFVVAIIVNAISTWIS